MSVIHMVVRRRHCCYGCGARTRFVLEYETIARLDDSKEPLRQYGSVRHRPEQDRDQIDISKMYWSDCWMNHSRANSLVAAILSYLKLQTSISLQEGSSGNFLNPNSSSIHNNEIY